MSEIETKVNSSSMVDAHYVLQFFGDRLESVKLITRIGDCEVQTEFKIRKDKAITEARHA